MLRVTVSTIIFGSTVLCVVIAIVIYFAKLLRIYKMTSSIPGPTYIPILGNLLEFATLSEEDMMYRVLSLMKSYSPFARLWLGPYLWLGTDDPEYVKMMLVDNKLIEKPSVKKILDTWLGNGVLMIAHDKWYARRKVVRRVIASTILRSYVPVFDAQSKVLVDRLAKHEDGEQFEVRRYLSDCFFDIISETTTGTNAEAQSKDNCKFQTTVDALVHIAMRRLVRPWMYPNVLFNLTPDGVDYKKHVNFLRGISENIIDEKKAMIQEKNRDTKKIITDNTGSTDAKQKCLVDVLLDNTVEQNKLSTSDVIDEINTFFFAGIDTTVTTLNFSLFMLANNPDVQEKAYRELCDIFGIEDDGQRSITLEDLKKMTYLERVINETLRLFPPVPFLPRVAVEDVKLGEYEVPGGTPVVASILGLHRNEKIWPDPLKFDPDRFLPEEVSKRHPYAFIPFAAGPRNCVGSKYAMLALKTIMAAFLRRYEILKDEVVSPGDIQLKPGMILSLHEQPLVRIRRRKNL